MICSRFLYSNRLFSTILLPKTKCPISYKIASVQVCNSWKYSLRSPCTGSFCSPPLFRRYSSTPAANVQDAKHEVNEAEQDHGQRRKKRRPPAAKTSLKQTALEAQRSLGGTQSQRSSYRDEEARNKIVAAYCVAEELDMIHVGRILHSQGYTLDPCGTKLHPQVVHIEMPISSKRTPHAINEDPLAPTGDVFIFPSGTVVSWGVSEASVSWLAAKTLRPAARNPLQENRIETEDLEYLEDPTRENSILKGDTIFLGTKDQASQSKRSKEGASTPTETGEGGGKEQRRDIETVLAKIAFSSGLARSTKLAVLESLLTDYFESTRSIPTVLSGDGRLPFTRASILQKIGQLLSIRAQLNLYSELTDSLPDLFWDSRHELGLEACFDQVGRALDVGIRIKILNEKIDYSQEIASVLREQLSEKHGFRLEWVIIILIAVEISLTVYVEARRSIKEYRESRAANSISAATTK